MPIRQAEIAVGRQCHVVSPVLQPRAETAVVSSDVGIIKAVKSVHAFSSEPAHTETQVQRGTLILVSPAQLSEQKIVRRFIKWNQPVDAAVVKVPVVIHTQLSLHGTKLPQPLLNCAVCSPDDR